MTPLKIIFMGTPDFAVASLRALYESGHDIIAVYTQPPRPKGRGRQVRKSPVHIFAEEKNIPVFHPKSLKKDVEQKVFADHKADLAIVAAYGLILPKPVLEAPKHGCINIHASLLPRWRGASPIQRAIEAGDKETGVTLMQMDEGLDTGAIIAVKKIALTEAITASILHDALAALGAVMIVEMTNAIAQGKQIRSTPQPKSGVTYAALLTKADGRIDWTKNAFEIDCKIRAFDPWPGVWTELNGKRMKILQCIPFLQQQAGAAGEILDAEGHIACGQKTALQILKLQPENAKPMDFKSALNGGYVALGEKFS